MSVIDLRHPMDVFPETETSWANQIMEVARATPGLQPHHMTAVWETLSQVGLDPGMFDRTESHWVDLASFLIVAHNENVYETLQQMGVRATEGGLHILKHACEKQDYLLYQATKYRRKTEEEKRPESQWDFTAYENGPTEWIVCRTDLERFAS